MAEAGNAFRGSRIGTERHGGMAGWQAEIGRTPGLVEHTIVSYWCTAGHESRPVFGPLTAEEIPELWDCSRCGRPAARRQGEAPEAASDEPFKSHLEYAKERRSAAEAEQLLEEALERLRKQRGE